MKNKLRSHTENLTYNAKPPIFDRAKELKRSMTKAERILWRELRDSKLGCKFRRQHPINKYVADFYCHELKLVIELDGGIHDLKKTKERDAEREDALRQFELTIIRFTNEEVFEELNKVISRIKECFP